MNRPEEITGRVDLTEAIRDPDIPVRPEVPDVELDFDHAFGLPIERDCTLTS